ncbi:MAG: hypothetical protein HDR23_08460 [Lachnospiraceae bacterium]|nr:hypothetical protein [Lachnospiraceae bacterium]MBD5456481.1 hypothetical protein [Lachnospiraceae bacterium]
MNDLLDKFNEYKSIVNYRWSYLLGNGQQLEFKLKQTDFPHLIGLHKLIDIPIIRQFNDVNNRTISAKFLISKIKKESLLTESAIKNSIYYPSISDRYQNFNKDNLLTVSYTDAVINFDASLIGSTLSSDYILFEHRNSGYNHLCIAMSSNGTRYAESFFHNPKDLYISGQQVVKIKKVEIYDAKGSLYIEDIL